MTPHV
jgi:hypothetical protein